MTWARSLCPCASDGQNLQARVLSESTFLGQVSPDLPTYIVAPSLLPCSLQISIRESPAFLTLINYCTVTYPKCKRHTMAMASLRYK